MDCLLKYGIDSSVRLEFADAALLRECGNPRREPLDDLAAAVGLALAEPVDYPPLALGVTPGDQVALVLDQAVPGAAEIVAALVKCLVEAGVQADGIGVLRTQADVDAGEGDPRRLLSGQLLERIALTTHDPTNRDRLAYLAATERGEPIMVNRVIHDADLVLPIGCFRSRQAAGYHGIHSALFPTYSDTATLSRFRSPGSFDTRGRRKKQLAKEADQVGWLLGAVLTIQVVPGPGQSVLDILAGEAQAVRRLGRRLYDAAWRHSLPRRAELVVAAVSGGPVQQTWRNLGRAVEAAMDIVESDGQIVLCSDLSTQPGPAMQRLVGEDSPAEAIKQIEGDCPEDTLPAVQIARALERGRVYLLSRLDPSLVEDLGIVPLADAEELVRLARHFDSCVVLANASYATATIEEE